MYIYIIVTKTQLSIIKKKKQIKGGYFNQNFILSQVILFLCSKTYQKKKSIPNMLKIILNKYCFILCPL